MKTKYFLAALLAVVLVTPFTAFGQTYTFVSLKDGDPTKKITMTVTYEGTAATISTTESSASSDDNYTLNYLGPSSNRSVTSDDEEIVLGINNTNNMWIVPFDGETYSQLGGNEITVNCICKVGSGECIPSAMLFGNVVTFTSVPEAGCTHCEMKLDDAISDTNAGYLVIKASSITFD